MNILPGYGTRKVFKFLPAIFVGGGSLIGLSHYINHSLLVQFYKEFLELNGQIGPIKPSEQLVSLMNDVEKDVKDLVSQHAPIEPFITPGLKTIHAGTLGIFKGGIIGLPQYFEFNDVREVDNKVKRAESVSNNTAIEDTYDCFLLSDKAKKFGIAREILFVNTFQVLVEATIPIGVAYITALAFKHLPNSLGLAKPNVYGRRMMFVLLTAMGGCIWGKLHSLVRNYYEWEVEENVAKLGEEYIQGGIEFYSKALERKSKQLDWKDQNRSPFIIFSDLIHTFVSRNDIPLQNKIEFYKQMLKEGVDNYETTIQDNSRS